jgi:hypothetical protein
MIATVEEWRLRRNVPKADHLVRNGKNSLGNLSVIPDRTFARAEKRWVAGAKLFASRNSNHASFEPVRRCSNQTRSIDGEPRVVESPLLQHTL